ncbi:MAG: glycosyltransferase family 2 protein, partial [Myxococcota bacterium]|nr:glycosyltransferase family 2 protein [Myxococcota bacterium]
RHRSGRFFNFNGTAGIWRRSTIGDAGGWEHDTLTEDLDLSYRAQSKGWQFVYVRDSVAPAEVPVEMSAFKSQQHRWAKGSIQVGRKLLPMLLRSKLPAKVKFEAFMHLSNNIAYVLMVFLSLLMPMAALLRIDRGWWDSASIWWDIPMFAAATLSIAFFYMLAQNESGANPRWKRYLYLPIVMSVGIGLCINNARAVIEALMGHQTGFVRTPKYGVTTQGQTWHHVKYRFRANWQSWVETAIGLYFSWAVIRSLAAGSYVAAPFLMLFGAGFLTVGLSSIFQRNRWLSKLFAPKLTREVSAS